nr:reverse transcriptase domain-containing protein [Tanacetum cinerariifolium]
VAQQGQVHPQSPAYVPDPMELDEHVPVHVPEPEHPDYHAPSDDDIQVEDDDEDPNEMHKPEDEDTREPSEDSDETEPFEEHETAVTPPPPRHCRARMPVRPQTPMAASTQALIDAFSAGSSPFPQPPTSPAYDQAPLGHRAAMIRMRDDILEEDMPPQKRFALTAPSPGCVVAASSAATARAPMSQVEDVGYIRALQTSELRMMTSIKEVNLRISYQAQVRKQKSKIMPVTRQGTHDAMTPESIQAMIDQAIQRNSTHTQDNASQTYTQRFQELALMCTKFLTDETEKVDKYISGLPDNIHGNVMSARPKTPDETIELANDLLDQKLRTYAERQNDNKRKA